MIHSVNVQRLSETLLRSGEDSAVRHVAVAVLGAFVGAFMASEASAQQAVPPRWNYQGSAVCPDGFDYYAGEGLCISRGGYGYGRRYGGGYGGGYGQGIPLDGTDSVQRFAPMAMTSTLMRVFACRNELTTGRGVSVRGD
jgi:hypothetical protein